MKIRDLLEVAKDVNDIKRKPLSQRTDKDIAFLNASKASKPKAGKVSVHLKHEDGTTSKNVFKLTKSQGKWDAEAQEIADAHLKQMQNIYDQFPKISGSRAVSVDKVEIK